MTKQEILQVLNALLKLNEGCDLMMEVLENNKGKDLDNDPLLETIGENLVQLGNNLHIWVDKQTKALN